MTREELVNNVLFKIVAREMKKKYPFIIYVSADENFESDLNNFETFYTVEIGVDTEKFLEFYPNFSINEVYYNRLKKNGSLSSHLWDVVDPDEGSDIDEWELTNEINETLGNLVKEIGNVAAIPDEYKLDRNLYASHFILK